MINLLGNIPSQHFYFACSGGKDSMVFLNFLRRYPKNNFTILYYNHGTEHGAEAESFITKFCEDNNLKYIIGTIDRDKESDESWEEYWRKARYSFFSKFTDPIVMCHHLNDSIENWIFTSAHGKPNTIPYRNRNVIRPFLKVKKIIIDEWAVHNNVQWIEDPSNVDIKHARNFIRHKLVEGFKVINPGLEKTIIKIIERKYGENND